MDSSLETDVYAVSIRVLGHFTDTFNFLRIIKDNGMTVAEGFEILRLLKNEGSYRGRIRSVDIGQMLNDLQMLNLMSIVMI